MKPSPHSHLKFKICVSGAAETGHCGEDALNMAKEVGREIAKHKTVLVTGATTGVPFWACIGAKEEGGISIGLSPAKNEKEHIEEYKLPVDYMDMIVYTGFGYSGRMGTLNEFTIAYEDDKPMGILMGDWETGNLFKEIVEKSHRGPGKIVYDSDPKALVEKVIELVRKEKIIEI